MSTRTEDPTGEQLIAEWTQDFNIGTRTIRRHRRLPRFTKAQIFTVAASFLVALSIGGERSADGPGPSAALAAPAPPADTAIAAVEVTDRLEIVELRGGDRASRSGLRTQVRNVQRRTLAPRVRWAQPLAQVDITSCYGPRWGTTHKGIDYDGETGDRIRSVGAGVVVQVGWRYSGLGNSVVVDHGRWLTIYAHASRVVARVGQAVKAGTVIARVGATGHVTGSHLHLAVADGGTPTNMWDNLVNPGPWLRARGIPASGCA